MLDTLRPKSVFRGKTLCFLRKNTLYSVGKHFFSEVPSDIIIFFLILGRNYF